MLISILGFQKNKGFILLTVSQKQFVILYKLYNIRKYLFYFRNLSRSSGRCNLDNKHHQLTDEQKTYI